MFHLYTDVKVRVPWDKILNIYMAENWEQGVEILISFYGNNYIMEFSTGNKGEVPNLPLLIESARHIATFKHDFFCGLLHILKLLVKQFSHYFYVKASILSKSKKIKNLKNISNSVFRNVSTVKGKYPIQKLGKSFIPFF